MMTKVKVTFVIMIKAVEILASMIILPQYHLHHLHYFMLFCSSFLVFSFYFLNFSKIEGFLNTSC